MTKMPTRLADFTIPREQPTQPKGDQASKTLTKSTFPQHDEEAGAQDPRPAVPAVHPPAAETALSPALVRTEPPTAAVPPTVLSATNSAALPMAVQIPQPMPRPAEEPRRQIGARVRASLAERLRTYMFVSRESQQDAVEAALDAYLSSKGF
jgi:hypothetical protein